MNISSRPFPNMPTLAFAAIVLSGCIHLTEDWAPKNFASADEAYPANEPVDLSALPRGSYEKREFNVPYADLFQIVDVSASQAYLDVVSSNSDTGVVLATSSATRYTTVSIRHVIFYKIIVNELGANQSAVVVITKEQAACDLHNPFWDGCGEWMDTPTYQKHDFGKAEAEEKTSLLFTSVRNNLINAGLL